MAEVHFSSAGVQIFLGVGAAFDFSPVAYGRPALDAEGRIGMVFPAYPGAKTPRPPLS